MADTSKSDLDTVDKSLGPATLESATRSAFRKKSSTATRKPRAKKQPGARKRARNALTRDQVLEILLASVEEMRLAKMVSDESDVMVLEVSGNTYRVVAQVKHDNRVTIQSADAG